ncbi:small proline-rich protein 4 [Chionomys nivalis]|uniref:small proline-rich protein 4 n=1 Tax=Chionomys nivalis TaxID=269649 RepID=UPI0025926AAB|nr:small proline-rich protein 4 [Chionomys nivalis]
MAGKGKCRSLFTGARVWQPFQNRDKNCDLHRKTCGEALRQQQQQQQCAPQAQQQQVKQPCQPPPTKCQEACVPKTKDPCAPQAKKQCPPKSPAQQKCPSTQQDPKCKQK